VKAVFRPMMNAPKNSGEVGRQALSSAVYEIIVFLSPPMLVRGSTTIDEARRVRVFARSAALGTCLTGDHLWAGRFDKAVADLFEMQDEIVARLANPCDSSSPLEETPSRADGRLSSAPPSRLESLKERQCRPHAATCCNRRGPLS